MSPKALGFALLVALPVAMGIGLTTPWEAPRTASASVSLAISLDELIASSSHVVVATAAEKRSQWEELGGAKRIVTYTRLTIDRVIVGEPGKEVWVRTLGGVVGKVGQHVAGDAKIALGSQSLLFLQKTGDSLVVAAMAQGHYPLVQDDKGTRLVASPDAGTVLPRSGPSVSAREQLIGITLDRAIEAIKRVRDNHAQK